MRGKKDDKVPRTVPRLYVIKVEKMQYTIPKLYIPKKVINGKKKPDLSRPWYVYHYFRNEETGIYDTKSKFIYKRELNRQKTVKARKYYGEMLQQVVLEMLEDGYNPYNKTIDRLHYSKNITFETNNKTVGEAFYKAIEDKKNTWATSTAAGIIFRVEKFLLFAKKHNFINDPAKTLKRAHVIEFLNTIKAKETATSVNNYRSAISSIVTQMVQNNDLEYNFVKDIRKEKQNPTKNHPFTPKQITEIKEYLIKNDPYLLQFVRMLAYSFLRNREVIRLQVKDVDLNNNIFTIKTKTKNLDRVYITDQLKEIFLSMEIHKYDPNDYVFTQFNKPGKWKTSEKGKTDLFSRRFKKVKDQFNLGNEYGIYSFRHSFAINVFENFIAAGNSEAEAMAKMLPITRHGTIDGLLNYLREKQSMMPKDYTQNITLDF